MSPDVTINLGPTRPEEVRCDFCHVALFGRKTWTYPCETFTPSVFQLPRLEQTSIGHWAACDDCHHLIEQQAWDALVKRVVEVDPMPGLTRNERRQVMKQLKTMYLEFQRHRRGPPYTMPPVG